MRPTLVLLTALLLAGCSGSKSKQHGLAPLQYARRADAVCARYSAQTARLHGANSVTALARIAERTRVLLDDAVARLHALPLPRGEEVRARRWLASLDRLRHDVVKIRDAARANDLAAVRSAAVVSQRDNDRSDALARRLGMQACASG